ncbi:MAG: hypothetical protein M1822_007730 [Bathelium mastoideum]|nr:MAG: hypothetical protein M1822_007730 [Bathelium mastoideum]
MAANSALSPSELELASSLSQEEIPIKLRCAGCSKLAVNAYRLPCCDQSICENCQSSLPESCPVCTHKPLSAEDCIPQKSLRLTCKAFLKSETKKRNKPKEEPATTPVTPAVQPPITSTPSAVASIEPQSVAAEGGSKDILNVQSTQDKASDLIGGGVQGNLQPSSKGLSKQQDRDGETNPNQEVATAEAHQDHDVGKNGEQQGQTQQQGNADAAQNQMDIWSGQGNQLQSSMYGQNFGLDGNQQNFSGLDWSNAGSFNPVMQMQMQNAMQSGNWNSFSNMMGMNGMGMDPMAMQNMFNSFGGGMGMTGMNGMNNMNMGMGFGNGFDGGWSGQQSSVGMGSNFGAQNGGYYPTGGYNQHQSHQGQFPNQMHHQSRFQNNNYHNQNRFRGQRGYGRGYGNHRGNSFGQYQNQGQIQNSSQQSTNQVSSGGDHEAFSQQLPTESQNEQPSTQASPEQLKPSASNESVAPTQEQDSKTTNHEANQDIDGTEKPLAPESETVAHVDANDERSAETGMQPQPSVDGLPSSEERPEMQPQYNEHQNEGDTVMSQIPPTNVQGSFPYDQAQNFASTIGDPLMANPMESMEGHDSFYAQGPNYFSYPRGRGGYGRGIRGGFRGRGRGYYRNQHEPRVVEASDPAPAWGPNGEFIDMNEPQPSAPAETPSVPAPAPPPNAPSGPKAMREGQTGAALRGRGGYHLSVSRGAVGITQSKDDPDPKNYTAEVAAEVDSPKNRRASPSPTRNGTRSPSRARSVRRASHSPDAEHRRSRSRSHSGHRKRSYREREEDDEDNEHEYRREKRRRHSQKHADENEGDSYSDNYDRRESKDYRSRDDHEEDDEERRRRRREKDKHRASRSHRDRSKDRHSRRRRSRSPATDDDYSRGHDELTNGIEEDEHESSSRRKSRTHRERDRDEKERDKYRDRDRESGRDRDRDRDREKDRERRRSHRKEYDDVEDEEYASRKRSRRDRDHDRDHDRDRDNDRDREHGRSKDHSRRSSPNRGDRDKLREPISESRHEEHEPAKTKPSQLTAPVQEGFKIKGAHSHAIAPPPPRHTSRRDSTSTTQQQHSSASNPTSPTTASHPAAFTNGIQPPTGPKADRNRRASLSGKAHNTTSTTTTAAAPAPPLPQSKRLAERDPLAAEREQRDRERLMRELHRRASLGGSALSGKAAAAAAAAVRRVSNDAGGAGVVVVPMSAPPASAPTGPRRERGAGAGEVDLGGRISQGLRGRVEGERRRAVRVNYEDEESEEVRTTRIEREREGARWGRG